THTYTHTHSPHPNPLLMLSRLLNDPFHEMSVVNVHLHPTYCILMRPMKSHLSKLSEDRQIGKLALEPQCSLSHYAPEHQISISLLLNEPLKASLGSTHVLFHLDNKSVKNSSTVL